MVTWKEEPLVQHMRTGDTGLDRVLQAMVIDGSWKHEHVKQALDCYRLQGCKSELPSNAILLPTSASLCRIITNEKRARLQATHRHD